jgi:phage terminase large subunit-like protein
VIEGAIIEAEALAVEIARDHLGAFLRYAMPILEPGTDVEWGEYLDVMCDHVEACEDGRITRLLFNIGPRHLKSKFKVAAVAWLLIRDPRSQHIMSAHDMRLSVRDALAVRDLVTSDQVRRDFGIGWQIKADQNNKSYWATSEGGHVVATSTGSDPIGFGAHYIWADDILSDRRAWSEAYRAEAVESLRRRLPSRLNDKRTGRIVCFWQRLHPKDPNTYCEDQGYQIVKFPLIYEPAKHPDGTILGDYEWRAKAGELLHPARWDAATVAAVRREFGERAFLAQYQQEPQPEGGTIVRAEWFGELGSLPVAYNAPGVRCGLYLDPRAGGRSRSSSFAVVALICWHQGIYYFADMERGRWGYTETKAALLRMRRRYPDAPIRFEATADGRSLETDDDFRATFNNWAAVTVTGGDTVQRLDLTAPIVQSGDVVMCRDFTGASDESSPDIAITEITNIPGAANDDIADVFSMGIRDLRQRSHRGTPSAPSRKRKHRPKLRASDMR